MVTLADRVVVVTGAGRGMGAGIAHALTDVGARTVLVDVRAGSAEATAARLADAGATAVGLTGDVCDDATRQRCIDAAEAMGGLDGWVNNAGIIEMGAALDIGPANFDEHLRVNTTAVFECCRRAAAWWRDHDRPGAIVNIASFAGKVGYGDMIGYNVSKAGVINLTRNLAHEWAALGINVNCICPSGVNTQMLDDVASYHAHGGDPAPIRAGMLAGDLGRTIEPIEIGRVVAFLLSDDARVIRGQAISVDGGDSPY